MLYKAKTKIHWKLFDFFEKKKVRIFIKEGQLFDLCSQKQIEKLSVPLYEGFFTDSPSDKYFYVVEMPYWRYKRPVFAIRKDVFYSIFEEYKGVPNGV